MNEPVGTGRVNDNFSQQPTLRGGPWLTHGDPEAVRTWRFMALRELASYRAGDITASGSSVSYSESHCDGAKVSGGLPDA